jgi:hypothetical protein
LRRDLERRLRAIEIARAGANFGGVWIEQREGMLRAPWGETMTRDAFEAARSGSATVVVLPDNCRDAVRRGGSTFVTDEVDERL